MLKITETQYRNARKSGKIQNKLLKQGITILMPEAEANKWLAALRSGEYKQVSGTMTDGKGGFCCLGVQQHCQLDGNIEVDEFNSYETLPTKNYLREEGIFFGDTFGYFTNNPYIVSLNNSAAEANDDVYQNKNHAAIRRNDFTDIAAGLEKAIAVY